MSQTTTKHALEASPFGNGSTGVLTISSAVSNLNSNFTTCYGTTGTKTLTVGSSTGYAAGNSIFIHYSHSTIANAANVGKWEFNYVSSVDSPTQLTLVYNLIYTYNYTSGTGNKDKSQCCKTGQYSNLTLNSGAVVTPSATFKTDSETNGIIAIKATNVTINNGARIHADGYGFQGRGGSVHKVRASAGIGLSGIINDDILQAASYYGGGGGGQGSAGGPSNGAGGGGGAMHTSYGNGGDGGGSGQGLGSATNLDTLDSTVLQMGSGGGGGSSNYDAGGPDGKVGGDGGGLIVISAKNITMTTADVNTLTCAGGAGGIGVAGGDCGGGGASGGTVYLRTIALQTSLNSISCAGGTGGTASGTDGRAGGNGGAGTVKIEICRYTANLTAYLTYAYGFSFCGGLASIIA